MWEAVLAELPPGATTPVSADIVKMLCQSFFYVGAAETLHRIVSAGDDEHIGTLIASLMDEAIRFLEKGSASQ